MPWDRILRSRIRIRSRILGSNHFAFPPLAASHLVRSRAQCAFSARRRLARQRPLMHNTASALPHRPIELRCGWWAPGAGRKSRLDLMGGSALDGGGCVGGGGEGWCCCVCVGGWGGAGSCAGMSLALPGAAGRRAGGGGWKAAVWAGLLTRTGGWQSVEPRDSLYPAKCGTCHFLQARLKDPALNSRHPLRRPRHLCQHVQ
jgi:hypothetical protein